MSATSARPNPYLVVDASVSLKWALNDEEAVAQAVALRNDALAGAFEMVGPSLWIYEVINGLVTAVRRGRIGPDPARRALTHLLELRVRLVSPDASAVYDHALRFGVAAYDAAYLALAVELNADLWTGDRRFYNAVTNQAPFVRWIGDYRQLSL